MCNVLLGGAIGDALGVFAESKPSNFPPLLAWDQKSFIGSEYHNLLPSQYSDDTMMSLAVANSLLDNNGFNPKDLAKRYVELFTSNTIRGYGRTTKAAIDNLISGKSYTESGIAGSYGNGSAMRAAPFGVYFRHNVPALIEAATIDAQMTHASEEAVAGSIAIALATAYACNNDTADLLTRIHSHLPDSKVKSNIFSLSALITAQIPPAQVLAFLGTKSDVRMTAPSALYLFMKMNSYREGVVAAIMGGNDTDTLGSITGALFGASSKSLPHEWVSGVENSSKLIVLDSQLYNRSGQNMFPRAS